MNRYKFGGLEKPGLYLDETVMRMCYTHRHLLAQLAMQLVAEGKNGKALNVLRKSEKVLPAYNVPNTFMSGAADLAQTYALIGHKADAKRLANQVWADALSYANYYVSLDGYRFTQCEDSMMRQLYIMQKLVDLTMLIDDNQAQQRYKIMNNLYEIYLKKGGRPFE